jgi:ABC-type branched-subunit amino acid transport system ATPase component
MLTRIYIKNFKRFDEVTVELGQTVVLIGPNNSGKTTILQALALWELGLKRWQEKRKNQNIAGSVTINRHDLIATSVPAANLLWRDLLVEKDQVSAIHITVEGITSGQNWSYGLAFEYANLELNNFLI